MNRRAPCLGLFLLLGVLAQPLVAAEPAAPAAPANGVQAVRAAPGGPLEYRQVFTPADQIESLAQGYLPLEKSRFQKLVSLLENAGNGPPGETLARVAKAEYTARLTDDDLLVGDGEWIVEQATAAPALLRLDPCSLALANVTWEGAPMTTGTLGSGPSGKPVALVRGAGKFHFQWSLRASGDAGAVAQFVLNWPSAGWIRLVLDLPADAAPEVEGGLAREIEQEQAADPKRKRWELLCGGRAQTTVQIPRRREAAASATGERLRQQLTYVMEERGGRFTAELELDVPNSALRELLLAVSPGLRLTAAWYGDTALTWDKVASAEPTGAGSQMVRLNLPEGFAGSNREVRIEGVFALAAGTPSVLPRMAVDGVPWQQGQVSLQVLRPLVLRQLRVTDARQTSAAPLTAGEGGEALEFQEFQRDARYEVDIALPEPQINLACGVALEFSSATETVHWEGEFTSAEGEQRTLVAELARAWVVEAVEAQATDGVAHWTVENRPGGLQRLTVQLQRVIRPGQPLRLSLRAHRSAAPVGGAISPDRLRFVEFQDVHVEERLLSLRAEAPWRVVAEGQAALPLVEARSLTPAQARRVDTRADAVLLRDDAAMVPLLALASEPPRFAADFTLEVRVDTRTLAETLRIRCSPEAGVLQRLIVLLAPSGRGTWHWSLADDAAETVTARRLGGNVDGVSAPSETWELSWRRARSTPFELVGQRDEEFGAATPLSLATAPAARSQSGSVLVFAAADTHVRVLTERLKPLLVDLPAMARMPLVAALRYEPAEDPFVPAGAVSLAPVGETSGPTQSWAWSARHKIRLSPGGEAFFYSAFQVESTGPAFELTLPASATLRETRVDGARVTLAGTAAENVLRVVLPGGKRSCLLEAEYAGAHVRLPSYGRLQLPLAQLSLPTFDTRAEVYLPAEYAGESASAPGASARRFSLWPQCTEARPFQPFTASDWRQLVEGDANVAAARRLGRRAFAVLNATWEKRRADVTGLTWGDLLTACDSRLGALRDPSGTAPRLLVDQAALRELGIGPGTAAPLRREADFGRVLAGANLVLLVSDDTLVLTSSLQAAAWAGSWQWIDAEPFAAVLPGELANLLTAAAVSPTRFATVGAWEIGQANAAAWEPVTLPAEPLGPRALPVVVDRTDGGAALTLVVYQPLVWQAWGWAVCVALTALAMLGARRSWLTIVVLGALSLALALFLPAPLAPLAQGAILGVLLGYALTLVRVPVRSAAAVSPESSTVEALPVALGRTASLGLLVVLTWAWLTQPAFSAPEPAAEAAVYQVLVPVDAEQKPAGEYWYLQRAFYDTLLARVAALQSGEEPWLLHSAQYQAELSDRGASEAVLQYALETLHTGAAVRLPLRRAEVELIPERALLDGRPVLPEWTADEKALTITVPETGTHRLELAVKPTRDKFENERGFEFTVPGVLESRLELLCTGVRAREVRSPTAQGAMTVSPDDRRASFALGAATQLAVRWPAASSDAVPLVDATKDALYWLRVRPGSVVLNERIKLAVQRGEVKQLRLAAGTQLRLLPLPADHVLAEAVLDSAARGTYLLKFKQPVTGELTFDLSYLVADLSGVGRLDVPLPKLEGVRANRRWLAVSPDPTLECEAVGKPAAETVSPAQFLAAWGPAEETPALVARLSPEDRTWPLSVRAREPRVKVTERTDVVVDRGQLLLRYEAQTEVLASALFQFRLQLPGGLTVEEVHVRQNKAPDAARWSVSGNVLTVFLEAPATKTQTLTLVGSMPAARGAMQNVPVVRLLDLKPAAAFVRVLRTSAVLVDVDAAAAAKAVPLPLPEPLRGERLLGAWEVPVPAPGANDAPPLRVKVSPNPRQFTARLATVLKRNRDEWQAETTLQLNVTQGVLDVVAVDLPAAWAEGIQLARETAYPLVLQELPDKARRRLLIWPTSSLRGAAQLQLRMHCQPGPGERLTAPRLTVPEAREVDAFLVLPLRNDRQRITWETSGLRASTLPRGLVPAAEIRAHVLVLRATEPEASASVARVEQALAQPLVRLADVQIAWPGGASYLGQAAFDLEPAQLTYVQLQMPPGTEFVRAESCGLVLAAETLGEGVVQCRLPVAQLPQRVEVMFAGQLEATSGPVQFRAPVPVDTPVERTLWTVWPPAGASQVKIAAVGQTAVFREELLRLRSAAALVEIGRGLVGDRPTAEIAGWYTAWARHVARVERHVAQLERLPGGSDPFEAAEAGRLSAAHDRTAAALGQTSVRQRLATSADGDSPDAPNLERPAWEGAYTATVEGPAPELEVEVTRTTAAVWPRWLAAAGLVTAVVLLFLLRLQGPVGEWLVRWPQAACVIVGILAWMWFSPSLVGLAIVAVSVVAAIVSLVQATLLRTVSV